MRLPIEEHRRHAWLVSRLAPDFELLDVWRYPIELDQSVPLDRFVDFMESSQRDLASSRGAAGALFRLRAVLGKIFGWDSDEKKPASALPIPGCTETSLRDRMSEADREGEVEAAQVGAMDQASSAFKPVYRLENETLREISNSTVHAFMHLGRVPISATHWSPQLGVYVKPRGRFGRFYMSLISPFRHYVVYPAMMRSAKQGWPKYAERHRSRSRDGSVSAD
jgi:hypothetical protein